MGLRLPKKFGVEGSSMVCFALSSSNRSQKRTEKHNSKIVRAFTSAQQCWINFYSSLGEDFINGSLYTDNFHTFPLILRCSYLQIYF